jgi:hypothetical protein
VGEIKAPLLAAPALGGERPKGATLARLGMHRF